MGPDGNHRPSPQRPNHRHKAKSKSLTPGEASGFPAPTPTPQSLTPPELGGLTDTYRPSKTRRPLRILDPACGSGSFLIGAYRYLLDYHRDWYLAHDRESHQQAGRIYQAGGGQWHLATDEKKRILLTNIFGVDIDTQAVEVTKLNLLLAVLENETNESLQRQLALFHERALPDLSDNIKCGNSLIGTDFYAGKQLALFDEDTQYRINAFDWQDEFPEVFRGDNPGFDAVIGNPPYIRVRIFKNDHPQEALHLEAKYACATHVWDIYLLFFEKGIALLRTDGLCSYILPIQTLHQPNCQSLRQVLCDQTSIESIVDLFQLKVFKGPIVKNCIIVARKSRDPDDFVCVSRPNDVAAVMADHHYRWPQKSIRTNPGLSMKVDLLSPKREICEKVLSASRPLSDLFYVTFGLRSCAKGKGGGGKDRLITEDPHADNAKPYLEGRDITRYGQAWPGGYIRYLPDDMYSPRSPQLFETDKIISQTMLSKMRLVATLDLNRFYVEQSLLCVVPHGICTPPIDDDPHYPLEFILGVLNSTLSSFFFRTYIIDYSLGGGLVHATPGSQGKIPIPAIPVGETNTLTDAVQNMISFQQRLGALRTDHDRRLVERHITATDRQIDQLVYELYGLTEEEIRIVEDGT